MPLLSDHQSIWFKSSSVLLVSLLLFESPSRILAKPCAANEFQCRCGSPECIGPSLVNNGIADCADSSDELNSNFFPVCPDGLPTRDSPIQNSSFVTEFCPQSQQHCATASGEVCIELNGERHCLCKYGYFRAPGTLRCVPNSLLSHFLGKSGANCSHILDDLSVVFPELFRSPSGNNHSENSTRPKIRGVKTAPSIDDANGILGVYETAISLDECNPDIKDSCRENDEVCTKTIDGQFKCRCASNRKKINGKCIEPVNECTDPSKNDCDKNAICIDNDLGYECLCREGYIDFSATPLVRPGIQCQKLVNECRLPMLNDCDRNSFCLDRPIGYTCRCRPNYQDVSPEGAKKPGRRCQIVVDNCEQAKCDPNAKCESTATDYRCTCGQGFVDSSPDILNKPGQVCLLLSTDCDSKTCNPATSQCVATSHGVACQCRQGFVDQDSKQPGSKCILSTSSNPCNDYSLQNCDANAECFSDQPGYFSCRCPKGFVDISPDKQAPGRKCKKVVNECKLGNNECDTNAECVDTNVGIGYSCRCRAGYQDVSVDKQNAPGRSCRRLNQCVTSDCAPEAECHESADGPLCQCPSGTMDVSRQHGRPLGRVCRQIVNECEDNSHDCSKDGICIDTAESFTCRCREGYRDESANVRERPGRVCVKTNLPPAPECNVNDPMSCDKTKLEVCLFNNGMYKCSCPYGYERLPDGRCLVINECQDARLNNCAANAECIDLAEGFTCRCASGFADLSLPNQPGRICRPRVNECANPKKYGVDCSVNAVCVDIENGYACKCLPGFADVSESFNQLDGRKCLEAVNECLTSNDCDKEGAICEDTKDSYLCTCKPGFIDASANITHYPGRVCKKPTKLLVSEQHADTALSLDSCDPNHPKCQMNEVCTDRKVKGEFVCDCADNAFRFHDNTCRLFSACESLNDCDKNGAICVNAFDTYKCQCRPGFLDMSPDPELSPGRKCKELVNECSRPELNTCSPFAQCIDATDGYLCTCLDNFVDTSSQFGLLPGRKCSNASNECAHKSLNTCDENSDCLDLPDGYTCKCVNGFVDVSSNANLPPGRVCVVQTSCPKQKTDLMFLIDGSGSIGSFVFKHEVLRFVREFVELFEVGHDKTRVGLIQYSDQIRHEFDLNQYIDKGSLLQAITQTQYLTGLTRTGAAIQHMVLEGFSERRGARPVLSDVSRVAIVITDGRSQDNVTEPSKAARELKVNMFAIGVTDHVLASELESIAGSPSRWFYVDRFKDLDTRLRSLIQKAACPLPQSEDRLPGKCNAQAQTGCDRSLNEVCLETNKGQTKCQCVPGFERHPLTRICGGDQCNPQVSTSCANPEVCEKTYFGNHRCVCPANFARDQRSGICISTKENDLPFKSAKIDFSQDDSCASGSMRCLVNEECVLDARGRSHCQCAAGFERNRYSNTCVLPGSCDPKAVTPCDLRKNERCLLHPSGRYHTCQCATSEKRHPVSDICLKNECLMGTHDCSPSGKCIDTDDGYLCTCPTGFLDHSPDPIRSPGRVCVAEQNECIQGIHNCSPDAICTDTPELYSCRCKPGYVDFSPNPHIAPGIVCKKLIDECSRSELNTCHQDAICIDTTDSYKCLCRAGFTDLDELRNPGRQCQKVQRNERCEANKNDCDKNARCFANGDNDFSCVCLPDFKDKSPDPVNRPGRLCIPRIAECSNPSLNDCDSPDRAICTETDESFLCRCRQGFLDISPAGKPGRLCKKLENECLTGKSDCAKDGGICEDLPDGYACRCAINYLDVSFDRNARPGRKCKKLIDECSNGQNDCAREAICTDTDDSYECQCPTNNFIDVSPDPVNKPGRRCLRLVNECVENKHQCSPQADCIDNPTSYTCKCASGFEDHSPNPEEPGRICRPALVDECRLGKHDCHKDAICQDLPHLYTCQCKQDFQDVSPNMSLKPGRMCVPKPTPKPDRCRLAECHPSAECIESQNGYACKCRPQFKDFMPEMPGRDCRPLINECQFPHLNDCSSNGQCMDLDEGFTCKCNAGFKDMNSQQPGRVCRRLVNECANNKLNSCDKNAICRDKEEGYECQCKSDFIDVSPSPILPGRACRLIVNECSSAQLNDCDKIAICTDTVTSYTCECPPNSRDISPNPAFPGRVCQAFVNECAENKHDCDANAICNDNEASFTCSCPDGYLDRSPNKNRLGRVCIKLVDECAENHHTCSSNAQCRDLQEGYTCECKDGFLDKSPSQPGRVCVTPEICPSNHECSSAAICEPLDNNQYSCSCIQGYTDQSPPGKVGRICVRNNACHDARLNNCSRNAICYSESNGYRCECRRGFIDRSVGALKGRVCELPPPLKLPPRHPCQDSNSNDCNAAGSCRATGPQSYTCECLPGYEDKSPDLKNKPGRICVLTEPACLNPDKNDCHPAAICLEQKGGDGYTCQCRDGFVDQSPDSQARPGRICVAVQNECLDRSLNDCDPIAICEKESNSKMGGYTCRCPVNSIDQSPNKNRLGRKCLAQINECLNPALNNCSRFADCTDSVSGYSCQCRSGYYDQNPQFPGTVCTYKINECDSPNLNDCHRNAECIDTQASYKCKCKSGYRDEGPADKPGRVCLLNECNSPMLNKCDKNADCVDTEDSYFCVCREGFYDESPNPAEPGRSCVSNTAFKVDQPPQHVPANQPESRIHGMSCGRNHFCDIELGEVCFGGTQCTCRPNEGRSDNTKKCQPIDETPLTFRVVSRGQQPLFYSSEFGNKHNEAYVEFAKEFDRDLGRAVGGTEYTARYVNTDISYITHPKTVNSTWDDGLLVNYKVGTVPAKTSIDACDLWDQLMESLQRSNGAVGGGRLQVASDIDLLDPCAAPPARGDHCGSQVCNRDLGESCIGGEVCGCTDGQKRSGPKSACHPVESWQIPLWVIRRHQQNLVFNESFANPLDTTNKEYVKMFEDGVSQCYPYTNLKNAFVSAEVNEIMDPMHLNASWDTGLLFNTTMNFRRGAVHTPSDAYQTLVRYIIDRKNYQVGDSGLYLNPYQSNPFSACYKNNCHPKGVCIDEGLGHFSCKCAGGYRDLNPMDPGKRCLPITGFNECERDEDNECSDKARCIDLDHLYKCECNVGFTDAAPKGAVPGSICVLDYCSDVSFCPKNSTCINGEQAAECECNHGYVDIRHSENRVNMGMSVDNFCLNIRDVDECALGLTNCSGVALCEDRQIGYACKCPEGYIDGNPNEPGRVCGALLCDMCNQHGDCVHDALTKNITCQCTEGYTGTFCEVAPSNAPLILLILLALLFLLLTLCCLLYLCTKCHCFKRYREPFMAYRNGVFPWTTLDHSTSSDSGADFSAMSAAGDLYNHELGIPRAKLKSSNSSRGMMDSNAEAQAAHLTSYLDEGLRIPRAHLNDNSSLGSGSSEYTIREEIERRVITDITTTELKTTTEELEEHEKLSLAECANEYQTYREGENEVVQSETVSKTAASSTNDRAAFSSSHAQASSSNVNQRDRFGVEENDRGESVAEFSNKEWHSTYKAGDYKRGQI